MPGMFRMVLFFDPGLIFPRIIPGGFAGFSDAGRQGRALPRTGHKDLFSWFRSWYPGYPALHIQRVQAAGNLNGTGQFVILIYPPAQP
jgi:hypothetical protein